MKLHQDTSNQPLFTSIDANSVYVAGESITQHLVLGSRGERFFWNVSSFEDLTSDHFAQLIATRPELILFGSGARIRFPHPQLLTALMQAHIGIETMDTAAACRTYNILASEGRHVIGAFLLPGNS